MWKKALYIYIYVCVCVYIHNLGYVEFYQKMQQTKSVNTIVCIPDLVIIKYFGNNTVEIKRIAFTYLDLLPLLIQRHPSVICYVKALTFYTF